MNTTPQVDTRSNVRVLIQAILIAGIASAVAVTIVGLIAHALGASHDLKALQAPADIVFAVIGVAVGAIAWNLIRDRSSHPASVLRWLVPAVVLVSLVPDVLLGFSTQPGVSWGAVAALMIMHVVVSVIAVATFLRVLPLPAASWEGRAAGVTPA